MSFESHHYCRKTTKPYFEAPRISLMLSPTTVKFRLEIKTLSTCTSGLPLTLNNTWQSKIWSPNIQQSHKDCLCLKQGDKGLYDALVFDDNWSHLMEATVSFLLLMVHPELIADSSSRNANLWKNAWLISDLAPLSQRQPRPLQEFKKQETLRRGDRMRVWVHNWADTRSEPSFSSSRN